MSPMRDDDNEQVKIELLSQWKLEAESRKKLRSMQCIPASLSHRFPILVANSNVANHRDSLTSATRKETKVSSSCSTEV